MWSFYVFVITFETKPQNEIVKNFFLMPSRIFAFMKICFCTVANKTLMHPNNARIVVKAIIVLSYPIIDLLPSLSKNSMRVL
jgi:hypothetical protein